MRCPFARWRGPVPNMVAGGFVHPARGLVLHVEQGTEEGTCSWFGNPKAQASAHFGVGTDGTLDQFVDTDDRAWAESSYNPHWFSVETEGYATDPLTEAQVITIGHLLAWLAQLDGFPIVVTDDSTALGLITHGDLGAAGGGHLDCPGELRAAQRADIVRVALGQSAPQPAPQPTTEDDKVLHLFKGDGPEWWLTDFLTKRHVLSPAEASIVIFSTLSAGGKIEHADNGPKQIGQSVLDAIPTVK